MKQLSFSVNLACCAIALLTGCGAKESAKTEKKLEATAPAYFKPDPATAGVLIGTIHMTGRHPVPKPVDLTSDPACVEAHHGPAVDESILVNKQGQLADVFVYIKSGLEGKTFEPPATPVTIDQQGCWFRPRIFGIQIGQVLKVTNSDPVTHNIHPLAKINREWNHSQGSGDPPLSRKFTAREVMIRVKCNIHSWMRAYIGVLEHPYFAATGVDGTFEIKDVPPGDYVIGAWHETLGTQEQKITVAPSGKSRIDFSFKGE